MAFPVFVTPQRKYAQTAKTLKYKAEMGQTTFMMAIFCGRLVSSAAMNNAQAKAVPSETQAKIFSKLKTPHLLRRHRASVLLLSCYLGVLWVSL
jgi:hypothetical protein